MDANTISGSVSDELAYYWGFISREMEVSILSENEDGAFLLRACISQPDSCTLAVRSGDRICRYRIANTDLFDVTVLSACYDFSGRPITLGKPVERPEGKSPSRPSSLPLVSANA